MTIAFLSPISLEPIVLERHFDITVSHHSVLALAFVLSALLNLKLATWLAACGDYLMAVLHCLQQGHPAIITLRGITLGGPAYFEQYQWSMDMHPSLTFHTTVHSCYQTRLQSQVVRYPSREGEGWIILPVCRVATPQILHTT